MYEEVLYAKDREIAGLNIVRSSVLKLLLLTKSGYALVSTNHLTQAIFPCFLKNWHHLLAYNTNNENLLIMDEFSINMKNKSLGYDKLDEFCNLFNLTNLIKPETCSTKTHTSLIDLFVTWNKYMLESSISLSKNTYKWNRLNRLWQTNNNLQKLQECWWF